MKKLDVFLAHTPETPLKVGTLVEVQKKIFFEYDSDFLQTGMRISPFKLQQVTGLQSNSDHYPRESFGVFNDSLPDGWGLLLTDRHFRKIGTEISSIGLLDRLAYLSDSAMGALTYHPSTGPDEITDSHIDLHQLSTHAMDILSGTPIDVLPVMMRAGGSPGGARPKILVGYDGSTLRTDANDLPPSYEHWLIKFRSEDDFTEAGAIEYAYYQMALQAGIPMSQSRLFYDQQSVAHFGTKRFDRGPQNTRMHVHSLAHLIHADFRTPSLDYEILIRVCLSLTKNHQDVRCCFKMMLFNIFSHNRDDHGKNFSFIMDSNGRWRLAPAYDLTFCTGPGGEHSSTIAGEGKHPRIADIRKIGELAELPNTEQQQLIEEVQDVIATWHTRARECGVNKKDIASIRTYHNAALLSS